MPIAAPGVFATRPTPSVRRRVGGAHGNTPRTLHRETAVDSEHFRFTGKARIFESQEDAVAGILGGQ